MHWHSLTTRYDVQFAASAARAFRKLPASEQRQIERRIDALSLNPRPRGVRKLEGEHELYRVHSGDYRIIYKIEDHVLLVLVVAVGHRREISR